MRDQVEHLDTCVNCEHNTGSFETDEGVFFRCEAVSVEGRVRGYEGCPLFERKKVAEEVSF